ncbi:YopX family protein [Staphylococcus coagulans]|uniref:YopX family protein n=1 Tax=Staphylococcus coagulans TaxID=74706 RepID=A0ABU1F0E3_9STAP|nr:YopX family protein [Staphylococcus coagulans]MDR5603847.1 YopX family protein [Staphylococcus coagulans]
MIPKFREFDKERHQTDYQKGMSYGIREDYDDSFLIRFEHMEDLDLVEKDGTINRVVMMSTGLNDAYRNEIYEKDIVRDKYGDVFLVEWLDGGFVLTEYYNGGYDHHYINDSSILEVIGNEYENPELLKGMEER